MSRTTTASRLTHRCAPTVEDDEASSRRASGRKPEKVANDASRKITHSIGTGTPANAAAAAATAPIAKGTRKNEPATPSSPTVALTATTSHIHRHVSGEPKSIARSTVPGRRATGRAIGLKS